MASEPSRASLAALIEQSRSNDYRDRAAAGRGLADLAGVPEAVATLRELVRDPCDTHVIRVTAGALLRRRDAEAVTIVASALTGADPGHTDWIAAAVHDVLGAPGSLTHRRASTALARAVAAETDECVVMGARQLLDILSELDPP
ncbi:HEAT repeat domain-containing protein [uncultured Streptomyces sp.]|uniref:HEAT repeat domain-containing protein n=1 Tax=uncultured Streptomyces sp. TaxID=174707 RepID=UPI002637CF56|nr:HEAT repeat domain-containing protein [uncultured Streptomyces sp.]